MSILSELEKLKKQQEEREQRHRQGIDEKKKTVSTNVGTVSNLLDEFLYTQSNIGSSGVGSLNDDIAPVRGSYFSQVTSMVDSSRMDSVIAGLPREVAPVKSTVQTGGMSVLDAKKNQDWTSVIIGGKKESTTPVKELTGREKAKYWKDWLAGNINAGTTAVTTSLGNTLDATVGNILKGVGWENNPVSRLNEGLQKDREMLLEVRDNAAEKLGLGKWAEYVGSFTEGTVAAVPMALHALYTGGANIAPTAANLADDAIRASGTLLQKIGLTTSSMMKNPQFWMSYAQSYGNEYYDAKENGASEEAAVLTATAKSLINSGIEIGIDGGSGMQGLMDDVAKGGKKLLSWIESSIEEGFEEVAQGFIGRLIDKFALGKDVDVLDPLTSAQEFGMGTAIGGFLGGGQMLVSGVEARADAKARENYLTDNETKVVSKEVENRVAKLEEAGTKVSKKDAAKIEKEVRSDLERGFISTDTIEEVLGGETYKTYQDTVKSEDSLIEQENTLTEEYNTLNKMVNEKMTGEQQVRRDELRGMLPELRQKIEDQKNNSQRDQLKSKLGEEVQGLVKDSRLMESYNEVGRRRQAFEADLTKYDTKQQEVIKKAVESGILNNTNRTHEFVDLIAKISADKGVLFDFTNNQKLKESGFAVDGKFVNGYVTQDGVTINIQSAKALNSVVGHEVTHVLEGTEFYAELQSAVMEYAKAKGEYQSRYDAIAKLYENIEGANIDAELTADLVGDYLFTDSGFISKLSTNNRNVFQKIYDEVKYLLKTATAGSKEAQQLEKVKRAFEKAYRETKNTDEDSGVQYSISETTDGRFAAVVDNDILSNIDTSTWDDTKKAYAKRAAADALKQFSDGIVVDGVTRKVNKQSRREYTRSNDTERLYNRSPDVFADKMRAAEVADDIVVAATNWSRDGGLKHPRKDNFVDFDHGTTLIVSGNSKYIAEVVVGITDTGDAVFYDVVDMTPTTFDIKKAESPTTATTQDAIGDIQGDSTTAKVTQKEGTVNRQFSLSDSTGRQLTQEQAEYFKDSKVRDENGNLLVVYHGTPNGDFTQFKDGTYFTDNKEYADRYQNPGASSISTGKTASNPKTFEVYLDIKKPFDLSDPEARRVYIEDYIKGGNAMGINPYLSDAEYAKIKTIDWTEGEDLREFLIDNGYDYDGLVLDEGADGGYGDAVQSRGKSYVVFSPKQIKNVDNQSPTSDPDIRYSLSNSGREVPLAERLTGDSLLDAQDMIAEIEDVAEVSPNGYVTVYHRTTEANAKRIIERGKMSAKEDGIFFSTQKDGEYSSDYGKGVVTLKVPVEKLVLDDIFDTEAHLRIPLKNRNQVLDVSAYIYEPGAVDTKQSLSAMDEVQTRYGDYNVYGKDVALETGEDFAPVAENAALVEENETITAEEMYQDDGAAMQDVSVNVLEASNEDDVAPLPPGSKRRKWVGTSTASEVVDGQVAPEDLDQELIHYQPISNKKTLGNANAMLDSKGYEASVSYMSQRFAANRVSLDDIALGERLIQEAVKQGDTKTAQELIMDISILGTELGQKVQALSIIKRLTPEGQLKMLMKVVERGKAKGDKAFNGVEVTQEQADKILKTRKADGTYDQAELNKAVEDVKQEIANNMSASMLEIVNEWRYLSMLGNPKTHIRNLVSNAAMLATRQAKNVVARTAEGITDAVYNAATGKNIHRTKTWKAASRYVRDYANQVTNEEYAGTTGNKYSESGNIKAKRNVLGNNVFGAASKFNSKALTAEDTWFSKPAFRESFREYLTANGIRTEADVKKNGRIVAEAKAYATKQAKEATFQQDSYVASKINEIEGKNPLFNMAIGAVLPFKKTPINIAKTGLAYSPLGIARNIYDAVKVSKGEMEVSEAIDHVAQTLTGTSLALIGYALASNGILNGAGGEDKEDKYDYQLGKQSYSLNFDGDTFSLSWLSPVAMPLFVGANAYEQLVEDQEWDYNVVMEALAQTLDPLNEMSFLSSLSDVLSSYDSGMAAFGGMLETAAQSYVTSFVPTLSSQIAQISDEKKRSTKISANSSADFLEETWNAIKYKVPGLRQTLEPATDIWGNEIPLTDDAVTKALETFIAPYARKEGIATNVDAEIKNIYRLTGENGVIPNIPGNSVNYKNEKYEMSAAEYTQFKKDYGQTAYDLMEALIQTDTYQRASAADKAKWMDEVFSYAMDEAKKNYLAKQGVSYTNSTKDGIPYYRENEIKGAIENDMTPEEYKLYRDDPEKFAMAEAVGGLKVYDQYKDATKDMTLGEKADYISGMNLSTEQKNLLINSETDRKEPIDLTGIEEYSSFEEFEYAKKYPEKYAMAKAVGGYDSYTVYADALGDIKSDKDKWGQSISGSRKPKVYAYIYGLDIPEIEQHILFKSQYPSTDDHNIEIIEYLNNRDDISYDEMVSLLLDLGFKVSADGMVRW